MQSIKSLSALLAAGLFATALYGCTPEVGTDAWCSEMKETPKEDWSADEAGAYGENCDL